MKILRVLSACALVVISASAFAACDTSVRLSDDSERFAFQAAGVVLDRHTGLRWQRCPQGQSWNEAASMCEGVASKYTWFEAMHLPVNDGWRVPNKKELVSIVAYDCAAPAWHEAAFGAVAIGVFWSSTPLPYFDSPTAWAVDFTDGAFTQTSANNPYAVRLVKGGD